MENRNMNTALTICAIAFGLQTTWAEPKGTDGKAMGMQKDMGMQKGHGKMGKMSTEQMIQNWPAKLRKRPS